MLEWKRQLERPRYLQNDNIRIDFKYVMLENVDWIHLGLGRYEVLLELGLILWINDVS
jgi:hypothetical protein